MENKPSSLRNILNEIHSEDEKSENKSITQKSKEEIKSLLKSKKSTSPFLDKLSKELNAIEYNSVKLVSIDEEVHEVFALLKKHKKIKIGNILSYLGQKFIEEHQKEILSINNNNNKYLKK